MIVALLSEAGANGSALLLDDGSLIGDGLCGAHVADELLDWGGAVSARIQDHPKKTAAVSSNCNSGHLRELMVMMVGPARGPGEWY